MGNKVPRITLSDDAECDLLGLIAKSMARPFHRISAFMPDPRALTLSKDARRPGPACA